MKKDRMKEMSIEVTVGAFMFMALLALGIFTIVLSQENFFRQTYDVQIKFSEVMGLRTGDNVFLRGVDVGKIADMTIERDHVLITARIEQKVNFTEDYAIEIASVSALGGKRLVINPGRPELPKVPTGTVLQGLPPKDVIVEATETIAMIRKTLEDGRVLENMTELVADFKQVSEQIASGQGTLGKLLMDDEMHGNLTETIANIKEISDRLTSGRGTLGRLFSEDDTMYEDLQATLSNLRQVSEGLSEGQGLLGRLLTEDDPIQRDLADAIAGIKGITESIESGQGSLGKLVHDDSLYEEAKLLLIDARAAIDDFRETSPITTFSSIFFGAF